MSDFTHCFVPLPDRILYPSWSNQVSLDMPFKEGWFGFIQLRITAQTPIYVRQALHKRPENIEQPSEERTQWADFFQIGGQNGVYGIPASSLNGMLRAVLAPATLGKLYPIGTTPGERPGWYARGAQLSITKNARESLRDSARGQVEPEARPDFAETLLGFAGRTDAQAKRASFTDAVAQNNPKTLEELGIRFHGPNGYSRRYATPNPDNDEDNPWLDATSLAGWKRYQRRVRHQPASRLMPKDLPQASYFRPLPSNTTFLTDLNLWNVRTEELGALLWILTWGQFGNQNPEPYCHQIGHAKPYGYGSITLALEACELSPNDPTKPTITGKRDGRLDESIHRFFEVMATHAGENWMQTPTIAALFEFAAPK